MPMAFIQSMASKGGPFGTLIFVLVLFVLFFKTFFVIVHKGQIAIPILRGEPARRGDVFGPISDISRWVLRHLWIPGMEKIERIPGVQRIKKHGSIVFRIPGLGMLRVISTMDRRNALDEAGFSVRREGASGTAFDVLWEIFGDVIWYIREDTQEVINAMFNADELAEIVVSTVTSALGTIYEAGLVERSQYRNNELLLGLVDDACKAELLEYGVSIKRLKIRNVREVPVQINPLADAIRGSNAESDDTQNAATAAILSTKLAG